MDDESGDGNRDKLTGDWGGESRHNWFLINVFLVSVSVGRPISRRWCTGVVFIHSEVKVNGAHYCDVLLLKQLLPYI